MTSRIKRFLPATILLTLMFVAYMSGLTDFLTFEALKEHRDFLQESIASRPLLAPLAFALCYTVAVSLSIPGAVFLTIFGGFLFPQPLATFLVVTGATTGAVIIYLIARTAMGSYFKQKAGPLLTKMREGLEENAASYLLFLRLVPLFPFWLVNIAPAVFGVPLFTYTWTTFIGIIPGSFVYAQAGTGLGAILDSDEPFSVGALLNRDVKIALVALGIFALIPIIIKKLRKPTKDLP